jgi:hypothetical protein
VQISSGSIAYIQNLAPVTVLAASSPGQDHHLLNPSRIIIIKL